MKTINHSIQKKDRQKGFALIEVMASILILGILYASYLNVENNKLLSVKSEIVGQQIKEISKAANRYITDNYSALLGIATDSQPALIRLSDLKAANILDATVSEKNAFGQDMCVLVMQPSTGKLTGLVVTEGGDAVNDVDLAKIVTSIGASGGGIYTDTPTALIGARGGWAVNTAPYSNPNHLGQTCSGASGNIILDQGHAAVALWFENNDLTSGFLYRDSIPGRPELNRMTTSLDMDTNDIQNAGDIDAVNVTASNIVDANAGIDINGTNIITNSRNLVNIGSITASGNIEGATLSLTQIQNEGTACSKNGSISRDASGKILSCQSGVWKTSDSGINESGCYWLYSGKSNYADNQYQQVICPSGYVMKGWQAWASDRLDGYVHAYCCPHS